MIPKLQTRKTTPALARFAATLPPRRPRPKPPAPGSPPDLPPIAEIIRAVLARVESPPVFSQPRGIVTAAGGKVLLTNAYVLFRLLRHLGCRLPIECWQLPHERDAVWQALVEPLGVRVVDARARGFVGSPFAVPGKVHFQRKPEFDYRRDMLDGYALKSYSMMQCDFREYLWLDADNNPQRNPTEAFDWPEFRTGPGYVCWPDADAEGDKSGFAKPVMSMFGLPELTPENGDFANGCESGQMLCDKTRLHNWASLYLGNFMSEHAEYFYQASWGEKCVPSNAARLVGFEPTIVPHAAHLDNFVCVQKDFAGRPFLFHRFGPGRRKWQLDGDQLRPDGFAHTDFCLDVLKELRSRWLP